MTTAGNPQIEWDNVDPSIYAQRFTNKAITAENRCDRCHALHHTSSRCPSHPRKRPWSAVALSIGSSQPDEEICKKYNRFNEDCKFTKESKFLHVCLKCRDTHPITKCKTNGGGGARNHQVTATSHPRALLIP